MDKKFLGKSVPHQSASFKARKRAFSIKGTVLMTIPFLAFVGFLALQPRNAALTETGERAVGPAVVRTLAKDPAPPIAVQPGSCAGVITNSKNPLIDSKGNFVSTKVFPLVPDELKTPPCTPEVWDRNVVTYFILKGLVVLNWLAGTLAVLATLYAGLLYISGFAKEDNVKKAKTLLAATYTGLFIVIFARIIIFSTADLLSKNSSKDAFKNSQVPVYFDDSATNP